MAVAGPLADEKALWRGDAQAVQGHVGGFGLEHKARPCLQGPRAAACDSEPRLRASSQTSPLSRGSLLGPAVLGAGQRAGGKAGEALPRWTHGRGLRWYDMVVKGMDSGALPPFPCLNVLIC